MDYCYFQDLHVLTPNRSELTTRTYEHIISDCFVVNSELKSQVKFIEKTDKKSKYSHFKPINFASNREAGNN